MDSPAEARAAHRADEWLRPSRGVLPHPRAPRVAAEAGRRARQDRAGLFQKRRRVIPPAQAASGACRSACGTRRGRACRALRPAPDGARRLPAEIRQIESRLLQHGGRPGPADRVRARSRDVHVSSGASDAARAGRAERRGSKQMASRSPEGRMPVGAAQADVPADRVAPVAAPAAVQPSAADLKTTAWRDSAVQAMLDVFPAEIEERRETRST